jgi:hypothetical protein
MAIPNSSDCSAASGRNARNDCATNRKARTLRRYTQLHRLACGAFVLLTLVSDAAFVMKRDA